VVKFHSDVSTTRIYTYVRRKAGLGGEPVGRGLTQLGGSPCGRRSQPHSKTWPKLAASTDARSVLEGACPSGSAPRESSIKLTGRFPGRKCRSFPHLSVSALPLGLS